MQEALKRYGAPEIFNTDQGSQFTSVDFTDALKEAGIRISMDGKGRWIDFYNERRPHSSLDDRTPEEAYTDDGAERSLGLRPVSCQPKAALNHEPGFHLSCDPNLSKGWGPPLRSLW